MWQRWTDDYLEWEPTEYGGVREIVVPPSKIWLPDFGIANRSELSYRENDSFERGSRSGVRRILSWVSPARRAESGGGVFGEGQPAPSHQLGIRGSAVSPGRQAVLRIFKCTR